VTTREEAYRQAKTREAKAQEKYERSLRALQQSRAAHSQFAVPLITGAFGSAGFPESGYGSQEAYTQGLRDKQLIAEVEHGPLSTRLGQVQDLPPPPRGISDDPTSTFNTQEGPFGRFGAGTGGVGEQKPPRPSSMGRGPFFRRPTERVEDPMDPSLAALFDDARREEAPPTVRAMRPWVVRTRS
jgi:hypothetical protein